MDSSQHVDLFCTIVFFVWCTIILFILCLFVLLQLEEQVFEGSEIQHCEDSKHKEFVVDGKLCLDHVVLTYIIFTNMFSPMHYTVKLN
jgi:hypothetical protein